MNLADLKIRTRLIMGFSALAALMALLGAASIHYLGTIHTEFGQVMEDRYPKLRVAVRLKALVMVAVTAGTVPSLTQAGAVQVVRLLEALGAGVPSEPVLAAQEKESAEL